MKCREELDEIELEAEWTFDDESQYESVEFYEGHYENVPLCDDCLVPYRVIAMCI